MSKTAPSFFAPCLHRIGSSLLALAWLATGFGNAQTPPATMPNGALSFNGQRGQGVEAPEVAPSPFNVEHALTIEAWINVSAWTKRYQALVTKGEAWGIVRADNASTIAFRTALAGGGGGHHDLVSTTLFPLGQWTHVAAVWTGSRKQLYVGGVLVADEAYSGGIASNNHPVMVGCNAQFIDRTLSGAIDSVRVWSVARTAEQLDEFRAESLRGSEPGLIADWRFNEAGGSTSLDDSAGARHGVLLAGKPTVGAGSLPQRVNGLVLNAPSGGRLAVYFNNRTTQYPSSLGMPPVADLQKVELPLPPSVPGVFDFPQGMTAEMWVNPQSIPNAGLVAVLSKGTEAWEVRYRDTGKITFFTKGVESAVPGGDVEELISKTRVEPREWTHVAAVWDPVARVKSLYINGRLDISTQADGVLAPSTLPVTLGLQPGAVSPPNAYYGAVDELRLWRYVRTPQEIHDNHALRVNGSEPGLAGVWSFDEAEAQAGEGSGRALAGVPSAGMSSLNRVDGVDLGAPRLASSTVDLDGESQSLTVADHPSLNGFTSFTIEAWVRPKPPKAPGFMFIVSKGEAGYGLALDADLHVRYMVNASQLNALKSTGKVAAGEWNHVAVVVDGAAQTTTFYINGKPAGSFNSAVIPNSAGALCIGKVGGSLLSGFFHGGLDEVRIWNSARTPTEVLLLAFNELPDVTTGLAAHWSFTAGDGSTVADRAGSKTASLVNATANTWQAGPIFPQSPSLPPGLNLAQNPFAAGLWVGEVTLTRVNEVQKAVNGAAEEVSPTGKEAVLRILLHVDASGKVRLLKDVIVMQTQAQGVPLPPAKPVLVTDPAQIHHYEGVVKRGGKRVGLRYSTVAYDFPGLELSMIGGIGPGVACGGRIDIDKSASTNPYRHKYHPDHGQGFDIIRVFSLAFEGAPGDPLKAAPGYGVNRLSGVYRESIAGLHKITLKTEGIVTLNRISTVPNLNVP